MRGNSVATNGGWSTPKTPKTLAGRINVIAAYSTAAPMRTIRRRFSTSASAPVPSYLQQHPLPAAALRGCLASMALAICMGE
jgi:hypothetical protein